MARRYTTAAEDRAFLAARLADLARPWAVGDLAQSFRNGYDIPASPITAIEGAIATLADGTQGHVSRLRRPRS